MTITLILSYISLFAANSRCHIIYILRCHINRKLQPLIALVGCFSQKPNLRVALLTVGVICIQHAYCAVNIGQNRAQKLFWELHILRSVVFITKGYVYLMNAFSRVLPVNQHDLLVKATQSFLDISRLSPLQFSFSQLPAHRFV